MKKLIFLLLFTGLFLNIQATDWEKWRGPDGKGVSVEKNWNPASLNTPKVKWRVMVGKGWAIATVKGNRLYTMGHQSEKDTIYCLDRNSGKVIWEYSYPSESGRYEGPSATPVYDNGRLYTISKYGMAFCHDAVKGKLIWKKDLNAEFGAKLPTWGYSSSFVIEGNTLLLNICQNGVAMDKRTGKKIWGSPAEKCGYSSPVVYMNKKNKEALFFGKDTLYSVNIKDGRVSWSLPWETRYGVNGADPIFIDGKIFISSGYNFGCGLIDLSSGKPSIVWQTKDLANHFGTSAYYKGYIYGPHGNTNRRSSGLSCIDAKTGKTVWFEKLGFNSIMLVGDKLVIQQEKGDLIIADADPAKYNEHSRVRIFNDMNRTVCWTAPLLLDGHIYTRSSSGEFVCIDVRK